MALWLAFAAAVFIGAVACELVRGGGSNPDRLCLCCFGLVATVLGVILTSVASTHARRRRWSSPFLFVPV